MRSNAKGENMNIYETLNDMQQEAVRHTEGPLLILAGGRFGKDQSADSQDRLSDRRKGGKAMEYSGYHLHE